MSTYFMFGKYSPDSIKQISAQRTSEAVALIGNNGGKLNSGYILLGEHDLVLIVDFPGLDQAVLASIGLTKLLGIAFTTSPAMSMQDFDKLVG